jgi:hypothetical protein
VAWSKECIRHFCEELLAERSLGVLKVWQKNNVGGIGVVLGSALDWLRIVWTSELWCWGADTSSSASKRLILR